MVAISAASGAYTFAAAAETGNKPGSRAAQAQAKVDAKRAELDTCTCSDIKVRLRAELRVLQADLSAAKSEGNHQKLAPSASAEPNRRSRTNGYLEKPNASEGTNTLSSSPNTYNPIGTAHFSGESNRIGTVNFDKNTPFGNRIAYV